MYYISKDYEKKFHRQQKID